MVCQCRPPSMVPTRLSPSPPTVARNACPEPLSASIAGAPCLVGSGRRTHVSPPSIVPYRSCPDFSSCEICRLMKQSSSQACWWPRAMLRTAAPPPCGPVQGTDRCCQSVPLSLLTHSCPAWPGRVPGPGEPVCSSTTVYPSAYSQVEYTLLAGWRAAGGSGTGNQPVVPVAVR